MELLIRDLQKIARIKKTVIRKIASEIKAGLGLQKKVFSLVFTDNRQIQELNREYFGRNEPTDVISFCLDDQYDPVGISGEIIISVEQVYKNADKYNTGAGEELTRYVIHGILHILGYDDLEKNKKMLMKEKEECLLRKIKARFRICDKNFLIKKIWKLIKFMRKNIDIGF